MTDRQLVKRVNLEISGTDLVRELGDSVTDLLFINSMIEYAEGLRNAFRMRGVDVKNVSRVRSELYPVGGRPLGETYQGSNIYLVSGAGDLGEYKFTGDELDPTKPLFIVSKAVRFGREFNQICFILERYKGRDLTSGAIPRTFAFFRNVYTEETGFQIDLNRLIRVQKRWSGDYLPEY